MFIVTLAMRRKTNAFGIGFQLFYDFSNLKHFFRNKALTWGVQICIFRFLFKSDRVAQPVEQLTFNQ